MDIPDSSGGLLARGLERSPGIARFDIAGVMISEASTLVNEATDAMGPRNPLRSGLRRIADLNSDHLHFIPFLGGSDR